MLTVGVIHLFLMTRELCVHWMTWKFYLDIISSGRLYCRFNQWSIIIKIIVKKKFSQRIIATLINKTNTDGNEMYLENENYLNINSHPTKINNIDWYAILWGLNDQQRCVDTLESIVLMGQDKCINKQIHFSPYCIVPPQSLRESEFWLTNNEAA